MTQKKPEFNSREIGTFLVLLLDAVDELTLSNAVLKKTLMELVPEFAGAYMRNEEIVKQHSSLLAASSLSSRAEMVDQIVDMLSALAAETR
jgi:hypothetical protein